MFSDENPFMAPVKALADTVSARRQPASEDNPLLTVERAASDWITTWLNAVAKTRDMLTERFFLSTYGSPVLQAMVGLGGDQPLAGRHAEHDLLREAATIKRRAEMEMRFEKGGIAEALARAVLYIRMPERSADERGFNVTCYGRSVRPARPANASPCRR